MSYQDIELINNQSIHAFEFFVEGKRSFIDYKKKDNKLYLIHTEVSPELEGRGVAAAMVEKAFKYIEANDLKIVPLCAYIQYYLKRHPEWNRLL